MSNRVYLTRLRGQNFRSLRAPFDLRLPHSGMTLIKGLNLDTGGSSGSGKSSLMLAISYLFGGCPFPGTELGSWGCDEPAKVIGTIETPDGEYEVTRQKGLSVKSPKRKEPFKGREAEAELDRIFGMDEKLRALVTYRGQGQPGLFLSMSDERKKEFLGLLVGLARYEEIAEAAGEAAKEALIQVSTLRELTASARGQLEGYKARLDDLEVGEDPAALESELESAKLVRDTVQKEHRLATDRLRDIRDANQRVFRDKIRDIQARRDQAADAMAIPGLAEIDRQVRALSNEAEGLRDADEAAARAVEMRRGSIKAQGVTAVAKIKAGDRAKGELAGVESELTRLRASECPTCERIWEGPEIQGTIAKLQKRADSLTQEVADGEAAAVEARSLKLVLADLKDTPENPRRREVQSEIEACRKQSVKLTNEFHANRKTALAAIDAEIEREKRAFEETPRPAEAEAAHAVMALETTFGAASERMSELQDRLGRARTNAGVREERRRMLAQARVRFAEAQERLSEAEKLYAAEADLAALVGRKGFLGLIFDDLLAEVASVTNDILSQVANVRHVSFDFEPEKESKNGNAQRRITPVIRIAGDIRPLESGLSGGMRSAVTLAVDLAVRQVASQRIGFYPGWLVQDESFDGLDAISKESCFEMLATRAGDCLVLCVDHASQMQGLFSQIIEVRSEDGCSTIT